MRLVPKNWAVFQHYKDRCPPWIKLHRDLLNDRKFIGLPTASKALAPLLWLLASENKDGVFDASVDELEFRLRMTAKEITTGLEALLHNGFFLDASTMLAPCLRDAIPEAEAEQSRDRSETEAKGEQKRATRLNPESALTQEWIDFCKANRPDLIPEQVFAKFSDYWTAKPGKQGTKLDWFATWRNWVREERGGRPAQASARPHSREDFANKDYGTGIRKI